MNGYTDHPAAWTGLAAAALAASSFAWARLGRHLAVRFSRYPVSLSMLAGLMAAAPALAIACSLTVAGRTYAATTAGSGAALTYLLIVPSALFRKALTAKAWPLWRRAVLPFCLATAAMWIIMGSAGHFWPLDGQFLITLFILGTWLFKLEAREATGKPKADGVTAAGDRAGADTESSTRPDNSAGNAVGPTPEPAGGRLEGPGTAAVAGADPIVADPGPPLRAWVLPGMLGLTALGLTGLGTYCLAGLAGWTHLAYLVPAVGALTCAGPLVTAARSPEGQRTAWIAALGYAAMAAACLGPGLAGFLQATTGAPPLYGPDGAFLALAAGVLLALGEEGIATSRTSRRLLLATWGIWLAWVLLSAALARSPAAPPPPQDQSVWE